MGTRAVDPPAEMAVDMADSLTDLAESLIDALLRV
jgi:hypothetical protein